MLLSQDNINLINTRKQKEFANSKIKLSRSPLGWALHIPTNYRGKTKHIALHLTQSKISKGGKTGSISDKDIKLDELIKYYFDLENVGIYNDNNAKNNVSKAEKILEETSKKIKKGWETELLWRNDCSPRIEGLDIANTRLISLERKLDRDAQYTDLYYKEMQRFIYQGYAKLTYTNLDSPRIWYLPHFRVYNASNRGKIRLMFDAAAKSNRLNQLEMGPDLLKLFLGVLLRFRLYKIGIRSDIQDIFLRVKIRELDQNARRFLWRGKIRDQKPLCFQMTSLIFGAKSSSRSAIFIINKNAKLYEKKIPETSRSVIENTYMDDFLTNQPSEYQVIKLINEVIEVIKTL